MWITRTRGRRSNRITRGRKNRHGRREKAIRAIKNGKSAGHDKMTPTMIKNMGENLWRKFNEMLTQFYTKLSMRARYQMIGKLEW